MKKHATRMGMPVIIEIVNELVQEKDIDAVLHYFGEIDNLFSSYKRNSELGRYNRREISLRETSDEMKKVLLLAEKTKKESNGYFDIQKNGILDPSGIVKGYAISCASQMLKKSGYKNYYIEIAGDIQTSGIHGKRKWRVGIKNPFHQQEIVKVVELAGQGIATSGTYIRGNHIYNPMSGKAADEVVSMTVLSSDIYDADRFATAAFAIGKKGIEFIESLPGYEGYMITKEKQAIYTSGFERYAVN